jgi:hypothetical protein
VIWLLLTGAGLVAETVLIVVLGRAATTRYDPGDALVERMDAVREAKNDRDLRAGTALQ